MKGTSEPMGAQGAALPISCSGLGNCVYIIATMARPKREEPFKRYNITYSEDLHKEVERMLPIEGARDFSSFLELASRRFLDVMKKPSRSK